MDSSGRKLSQRGRKWTDQQKQEAFVQWSEWYADGWSIRRIARQAGRSYGSVHSILTQGGVTLRSKGGVAGSTRK